jgi:hypothetical protein
MPLSLAIWESESPALTVTVRGPVSGGVVAVGGSVVTTVGAAVVADGATVDVE